MADVFISYKESSAGKSAAQIAETLESVGISCWYAKRDMPSSGDFARDIPPEIGKCKLFLLILNHDSVYDSRHVENEVGFAFKRLNSGGKLKILPLEVGNFQRRLEEEDFGDNPDTASFDRALWLDYYLIHTQSVRVPALDETHMRLLTERIAALLGRELPREEPEPEPPPKRVKPKFDFSLVGLLLCFALLFALTLARLNQSDAGSVDYGEQIRASGQWGDKPEDVWTLDYDGVLTISGVGEMKNYWSTVDNRKNLSPWWEYGDNITKVVISDGITRIGNYAFQILWSVRYVSIPDSVTEIGQGAFFHCDALDNLALPNGIKEIETFTFQYCSNLTYIKLNEGITSIGISAFAGCTNLKEVSLPNSLTTIDTSAFSDCTRLSSITIPSGIISLEAGCFSGCSALQEVVLSDKLHYIGVGTFAHCTSLSTFTISNGVDFIEDDAFAGCTNLHEFLVDENQPYFRALDGVLFNKDTSKLVHYPIGKQGKTYAIPNGVTEIGREAFQGCVNLIDITIPNSVSVIRDMAFSSCKNLSRLTLPKNLSIIEGWSFYRCESLEEITIPSNVTEIGGFTFEGCISLTSVKISDSVTTIGISAFGDCVSLTNVEIPDSVTEIGKSAFNGCSNLTDIKIPDNVTTIRERAFKNCTNLISASVPAGAEIEEDAFPEHTQITYR